MHRLSASSTSSSDPAGDGRTTASRGVARALVGLGLPAALTVAALIGLAWWHRAWIVAPIVEHGTLEAGLLHEISEWQSRDRARLPPGAVLFGNSLTDCRDGSSVGGVVDRELAAAGSPHSLITAWGGAFGPLQYYFLLDEVLAGAPAVTVVEVDPLRLALIEVAPHLRYLAASRKLTLGRALEVRQALAAEGLTLFDPLQYRIEEALGLLYVVPGLQERWRLFLFDAGGRLNGALGLRFVNVDPRALQLMRFDASRARTTILADQTTNPRTTVLRILHRDLRQAGGTVLFYVSPVNTWAWAGFTPADEALFAQRLDALRLAVGAAPDEWLDLHARLPSTAFRDWVGHMFPAGCEQVGTAISEAVIAQLRPARAVE